MNYLNRKNAQDTYQILLSGVRKEVPAILRPYINVIQLGGMVYDYNPTFKEFYLTIKYIPYSRNFIAFLVTLASIKKDYKILNMYEKKFKNNVLYDAYKDELDNLVESRVEDFDFNLPIFKKLILGGKLMGSRCDKWGDINELVKYVTNKYSYIMDNEIFLKMIQDNFITKEDLESLKVINPVLANYYLNDYDYIKFASLVRKFN